MAFLLLSLRPAHAAVPVVDPQDTNLVVLVTGTTQPLISRVTAVNVDTNAPGGIVEFDLGFATQEVRDGSSLIDSMTVTLLDADEHSGAVLLVADANGVAWTPLVPGGVSLTTDDLNATVIDLPQIRMGLPGLNAQLAYHLAVRIPRALWGPQVKLALDVFDYPNGLASVAWAGPAQFVPDFIPACAPPPLGLAAWWKAEGDALDAMATHHGVLHGGVSFAPGRVGQAFLFDGTDGAYVSVPSRPELSPQAGAFPLDQSSAAGGELTVETWVKLLALPSPAEGRRTVVAKGDEYELSVTAAGAVQFIVRDSNGSEAVVEGGAIAAGAWHHLAGTFRQGQFMRCYVDGVRLDELFAPGIIGVATAGPLLVGRRSLVPPSYFRGLVDEVTLYHHALTDSEVASLHLAGSTGKCLVPLALELKREDATMRLRWLRAAGGAVLEESESLGANQPWGLSSLIPSLSGEHYVADVPSTNAAKFYRLRR